ncbi:MAG: hypothetical protein JXB17_12970 [Bacteroidales bacterium]|nr:hypothetical protein [Bacteroidales bacterium]
MNFNKQIRIPILLSFILFSYSVHSQSSFSIGYSINDFTKPLGNYNILVHQFNESHAQYDKLFSIPKFNHGFAFSWFIGDKAGMELNWINRHAKTKAEGIPDTASVLYNHFLKTRMNTFGWGFFYRPRDFIRLGYTMDFGKYKLFKKYGSTNNIKKSNYTMVYNKGLTTFGFTLYVDLIIGNLISVKPFYHIDTTLFSNTELYNDKKYYYNLSHFGITGSFLINPD